MLGFMGEISESVDERADDKVEEQIEDDKKVVDTEPTETRSARSGAGRWLGLAALLLALAALAITVINVVRPDWTAKFDKTPVTTVAPPPGPSEQQVAEAKTKACDAYNVVGGAVTLRTSVDLGPTPAPVDVGLVEANARQTFASGSEYLVAHLDSATPAPLADAVKRFSAALDDIAINSLAGVNNDDPAQAARLQSLVDINGQINELCK